MSRMTVYVVDDCKDTSDSLAALLSAMGHDATAMRCWGFAGTLVRGTEWAATGAVTLPLPKDFPTADKASPIPEK